MYGGTIERMRHLYDSSSTLHDSRQGNSIIEAVVAASLVIIGLVGIVQLVTRSFQANEVISDRFTAAHLAAEGVEIIRNRLEVYLAASMPWSDLPTLLDSGNYEVAADTPLTIRRISGSESPNPLLFDQNTLLFNYDAPQPYEQTKFYRTVEIKWNTPCPSKVSIESIVRWTTRGTAASIDAADEMYSWRGAPVCI